MALASHPGTEAADITWPGYDAENVNLSGGDYSTGQTRARGFYVGTAGHVTVLLQSGRNVTFFNVPAGQQISQTFVGIVAASTTASQIVAIA